MSGAWEATLVALDQVDDAGPVPHYRDAAWVDQRDRDEMWGVTRDASVAVAVRRDGESVGLVRFASARWPLWLVLATLAELETAEGHAAEAAGLLAEAREIVMEIASHVPGADMRADFLATPAVKALLGKTVE